MHGDSRKQRGFSLIELLTVMAIIAVLASLMLPVLGRARETATSMACANTVRHLATASLLAAEDNEGRLPTDFEGPAIVGFHYQILPYLRESAQEEGVAAVFGCPAVRDSRQDPEWHLGMRYNYAVNQSLPGSQVSEISMPAQRVMFVDSPATVDARATGAFSAEPQTYRHRGTVNAAYMDGHMGTVTSAEARAQNRLRRADLDPFGTQTRQGGVAFTSSGAPARPTGRPERWADTAPRPAPHPCPLPSVTAPGASVGGG